MRELCVSGELTPDERDELARYEGEIERDLVAFLRVGTALLKIRESRLYRAYGTFEDYCLRRWDIGRSRIYQLMDSARVMSDLAGAVGHEGDPDVHHGGHGPSDPPPTPVLPTSERQARPLARLAPEERPEAWREVVATAPGGKVTSRHIESVVERRTRPSGFPAVPGTPLYAEGRPILEVPGLPDEPGLDDPDEGDDGHGVESPASPVHDPAPHWGEDSPDPAPVPIADVLDTWIETLPLHRSLADDQSRALFASDACLFRDFRLILEEMADRTKALLKKYDRRGAYHAAIRNFYAIRKPQNWVVCPPEEAGGCGGTGISVDSGRTCPACRGRGYRLNGVATQKQIALLKRLGIPDGACLDPGTASEVIDDRRRMNGRGPCS